MSPVNTVSCLHCGEQIEKDARACPYCGSDENTGWSENVYLDGIDLPDEESYNDTVENEFGGKSQGRRQRFWVFVTAFVVLTAFAIGVLSLWR
jgi:glutaredoxin